MVSALYYIGERFLYRLTEFFEHWYVNSFYIYGHFIISILERLDRGFAFKITLRNIFNPLYQDRSIIGYVLGFIFRLSRLIIGGVVYVVIIGLALAVYLVWLAVPVFIIYKIFANGR